MIPDERPHDSIPCPHCLGETCMPPDALELHLQKFHGQTRRESQAVCLDLYT
jgi:hypothetical protein